MSLQEGSEYFDPQNFEDYIATLPKSFISRLQLNRKGLSSDYMNNFASLLSVVRDESFTPDVTFLMDLCNDAISNMLSYEEHLQSVIDRYNNFEGKSTPLTDSERIIQNLANQPDVPYINANIQAMKQIHLAADEHFAENIQKLRKLTVETLELLEGSKEL